MSIEGEREWINHPMMGARDFFPFAGGGKGRELTEKEGAAVGESAKPDTAGA